MLIVMVGFSAGALALLAEADRHGGAVLAEQGFALRPSF
ncbi:hypothetical protein SDC9_17435 [bioreactor metagenome]|uniref:Uncharacterized protein n=1 Tax=bioreactor metagenome TaxID=1076179 RepID=A0A644TXJ9_9ZZZZ